jgi:anti-sigma regulatory factor (Ser/Thr protein kinase)
MVGKNRRYRGSLPGNPVENHPPTRYNGGALPAHAAPTSQGGPNTGMIVPSSPETASAVTSTELATSAVASPTVASIAGSVPDEAAPSGPPGDFASFSPHTDPPRIAVYDEPRTPPVVVLVTDVPPTDDNVPALIEALAGRTHELSQQLGGRMPITVLRELVENLVHASFAGVVITILDQGNTVRVSDRGPGISDKEAALLPGFTSADAYAKRFIRGVGSGFSVVKQTLAGLDGVLHIEDNLGRGTVVTARVSPLSETPLASAAVPAYNLSQRQLKTLLLTVELAPVGPTRIAQELGVSTSTAYRDLVSLEDVGFVISQATGHRSVTEEGLAYLNAVL